MKKISYLLLFTILLFITGCEFMSTPSTEKEPIGEHEHDYQWVYPEDAKCGEVCTAQHTCSICGDVISVREMEKPHDYIHETKDATCSKEGYIKNTCKICGYVDKVSVPKTEHQNLVYVIDEAAPKDGIGYRHLECSDCGKKFAQEEYVGNGYAEHGKLSVSGADLVDKDGEKFQLYGLSTHGLQWANKFVNFESFHNIQQEFGINVIRLSLYTEEGGYSTSDEAYQKFLLETVCNGIDICTKLNMYVLLDWHQLGPNLRQEDALYVFDYISNKYKDQNNIIYEIMNEPYSNSTKTITWADCKAYATRVIPVIRANQPGAVVIVGSPKYSTDLSSIYSNPLAFSNVMYTYHFYAASHRSQYATIESYYNKGLPIFITEHGGMEATGDGAMNYVSVGKWYETLNRLNISYVAWNISNTKGSASIVVSGSEDIYDFTDSNLKEWGRYYKTVTRERAGLTD